MIATRLGPLTPTAMIGLALVALNIFAAVFGPLVAPHGETEIVARAWQPPSAEFWLGTDNLGRDLFSRILYGARTSIGLALAITCLCFAIGVTAGFLAAVSAKWLDLTLSRIADLMLSIPTLISAFVVLSALGTDIWAIVVTIAILESSKVYRLARSVALAIATMEYVDAARTRGEGYGWIMMREVLPNALPPLAAEFGLRFCFAFLFVAALSFLGLGIQPPDADWGSMVRDMRGMIVLGSRAPLYPAAAIALLTIGVNFLVDWLLSLYSRGHGKTA